MSAQGLSSAKKRRGVGRGEFGGTEPVNAKVGGSGKSATASIQRPNKISTQDAIYLLNSRIMSLEAMLKNNGWRVERRKNKWSGHAKFIASKASKRVEIEIGGMQTLISY